MPWTRITADRTDPQDTTTEQGTRILEYWQAVNEGISQAMEVDDRVFVMGQGVDDPSGMFGATRGLHLRFGPERSFDTPLSETALSGIALGASLGGLRPVYFHNRPDFLTLAMDQLVNHASKWRFMFGGRVCCPVVIWACIGRGWGSAAQHSQALQGLFNHVPGLKLVMPGTCFDAKGLMLAAIKDNNPVLIIDHRFNFRLRGAVPEHPYLVPLGKAAVRRVGSDVTVVATSHLVADAYAAARILSAEGIEMEIIDPITIRPLDLDTILTSVAKTGRVVIADTGWRTGGVAASISADIVEKGFSNLLAPILRVTPPDLPTPSAAVLEEAFYVGEKDIVDAVRTVVQCD